MSNNGNTLAKYKPAELFKQQGIQDKFKDILGSRAPQFVTSVLQAISDSKMLAEAKTESVYHAATTAAVLNLPINPNLGYAYIIPYRKGKGPNSEVVAQFQMGYKGYIQLAHRTNMYKKISAAPIYKGQIVVADPLKGYEFDFTKRESDEVIGYAAYFRLINTFEKTLYMTTEEVKAHADKYSDSYGSSYSAWNTSFDAMAEKTVLKQLLDKYGPKSTEMQIAIDADQGEIKGVTEEGVEVEYIDNQGNVLTQPAALARAPQRLANRRAFAGAPKEIAQGLGLNPDRVRTFAVGHHEAHLASAAATAPWDADAAVSIDGFGDFLSTLSARMADGGPVETGRVAFPHSLGVLYQAVTQHLGFRPARAPRDRRRHAGPRSGSRR